MSTKKINKNSKEYQENLRKQQFLKVNGVNVKLDGSWGPWQEQQYKKLITKKKEYPVTLQGAWNHFMDKLSGNDTYQVQPATITADNRSNFGRFMDNQLQNPHTFLGYMYQNIIPAATVASLTTPMGLRTVVPAFITGAAASGVADKASVALTGETTEDKARNFTGNELSFLGNPGTYVGGKVGYNYKNLGRFVMDNVYPANYGGHGWDFARAYAQALNPFSRVPRFFNGRRPKWYKDRYSVLEDNDFRLENMAQWAGVSEKEIPRVLTVDNGDGTRGFTRTIKRPFLPDTEQPPKVGEKYIEQDQLFGVGGEHSDYILKDSRLTSINPQQTKATRENIWLYEDEQKINPQWIWVDKIKKWYGTVKYPKVTKFIDYLGNKDLKWMLGFDNDIKYRQFVKETQNLGLKVVPDEASGISKPQVVIENSNIELLPYEKYSELYK